MAQFTQVAITNAMDWVVLKQQKCILIVQDPGHLKMKVMADSLSGNF